MKNILITLALLLSVSAQAYLVPGDSHDINPYQPQPAPYNPYQPQPGYGSGTYRSVVRCENHGPSPAVCGVGGRILEARIIRQLSNAACVIGANVRIDRSRIIVMDGCRADFEVLVSNNGGYDDGYQGGHGGGYPNPHRPVRTTIVQCSSNLKLFKSCEVGGQIIDVQLVDQRSNSPCELGRSWGYDHSRVWVDRGCRASFRVVLR
ncbi:MAG: DUF3011 domain-containing protein [Pseudobdellovibrio sp.]